MIRTDHAVYLGGGMDKRMDVKAEVRRRIASVFPVLKSLENLWKSIHCSTKWKLQVFNAVCIAKVAYSLETLQYTDSVSKLLDTFQLKGFRKIIQVPHTFIDRYWSAEKIFEKKQIKSKMFQDFYRFFAILSRNKRLGQITGDVD